MPTLNLTVRWLTDAPGLAGYHGEEWPPTPSRVFRALLAGALRPGGAGDRGISALRRLERAGPPVIVAPQAQRLSTVRSAVPNNDGDRVFDLYEKGATSEARKRASQLKTLRSRSGWAVPVPVHYRWEFEGPDPDPEAFVVLAAGLSILGQGADVAFAHAVWSDEAPQDHMHCWIPDDVTGDVAIPVPSEGEVQRLVERHKSERRRVDGPQVASTREPQVAMARYRDPLAPPPVRWQAFALRTLDDQGSFAVPGREAMRVSGMVRHAIDEAADSAGLDDDVRSELMGHGGDARFGVLPVPNVAHRYADGRIRRVIVRAPLIVAEKIWAQILHRLTAAELVDAKRREPRGLLVPITRPEEDRILWRFTDRATFWTSAIPVILPGFDKRGGRSRPGKIVRRMLRHASIPADAVRQIRLDDAPRIRGVQRGGDVEVPHYLRHFPRKFLSIEFHSPVVGPLTIGAGRWNGLGTMVHGIRN